jgi:outer membrane protein assembly factor BamE (lipoprotein component of BamABCDE complex)
MKTLNENQKDILGTIVALSLFWAVIGYLSINQGNYCQTNKVPQIEEKQTQSLVLEKYGELITKHSAK